MYYLRISTFHVSYGSLMHFQLTCGMIATELSFRTKIDYLDYYSDGLNLRLESILVQQSLSPLSPREIYSLTRFLTVQRVTLNFATALTLGILNT